MVDPKQTVQLTVPYSLLDIFGLVYAPSKHTHHLPFKHNGLELPNKHIQLKRHVFVFYVSSPPKAQAPARDPYDAIQSQTMHQEDCRSKSADPALQGKRRVKQCLPLKSSSNVSLLQSLPQNVSNDFFQSTFFHRFPEMLSLNVI